MFDTIAPVYALFFKSQQKSFRSAIERAKKELDISAFDAVIDVGCGTGALCSVLREKGLAVTGIDPAEKMLEIARKKPENKGIEFVRANVLEMLPFADRSFDLSMASFVAHGLRVDERKRMYVEMSRVTRSKVVIYDYNSSRSPLTSLVEWLERGDYFQFIKVNEDGLRQCVSEMNECFSEVRIIDVDQRAAWYICTPNHFGKPT